MEYYDIRINQGLYFLKILIQTGNYTNLLLKYIDDDQLPAYMGGTKVDENGDERCSEWVRDDRISNLLSKKYIMVLDVKPELILFFLDLSGRSGSQGALHVGDIIHRYHGVCYYRGWFNAVPIQACE